MNTWSWIFWLSCALIFISVTRNPLCLVLLLLVLNLIFAAWYEPSRETSLAIVSPLKFSVIIIFMTTVFNSLTSHFGETVLFTIPGKLPLFSGPVTMEAALFGFSNGLALSGMLTAFTIINVVLPVAALIRLTPRAFYPLSIVVSIALTFLPSIRQQIEQVLEAQTIRGHRLSGWRDWLPLFLPLLVGGLERSIQLAETMTARGFASQSGTFTARNRAFLLSGLLLAAAGWIASQLQNYQYFGMILLTGGVSLIGIAIWQAGKQLPRTSYKKESWNIRDILSMCCSIGLAAFLLFGLPEQIKVTLYYQPYPKAAFPAFGVGIGLLILILLHPILLKRKAIS